MQQARALQQSEAFAEYCQRRVVVEDRLARLVQLGIRRARYFGRAKTRFQLYLAATVANLTLVALPSVAVPPAPTPAVLPRIRAPHGSAKSGPSFCSRRPYSPHSSSQQGVSVRVYSPRGCPFSTPLTRN